MPTEPQACLDFEVAQDGENLQVSFVENDEVVFVVRGDADYIDNLTRSIGLSRSEMSKRVPLDLPDGTHSLAQYDPRYYVLPDTTNQFATLWIRHPGLGWHGFGFPRHEAGNISKWLRKVVEAKSTQDTQSNRASSLGGQKFLITTEGLGFYWYGEGENRIGPNPFEQIEFDSDRAAGIVAAALVERRLEEALQKRTMRVEKAIIQKLFLPSGALGSFSVKIDLAFLLNLVTDKAHRDLITINKIRNDFAHKLDLDDFDIQSVKYRCLNLKIVDDYVGPIPDITDDKSLDDLRSSGRKSYLGLPDHSRRLRDPRFRYVMTAQVLSYELGQGSDSQDHELPLI
jgi:hypothetical protein